MRTPYVALHVVRLTQGIPGDASAATAQPAAAATAASFRVARLSPSPFSSGQLPAVAGVAMVEGASLPPWAGGGSAADWGEGEPASRLNDHRNDRRARADKGIFVTVRHAA